MSLWTLNHGVWLCTKIEGIAPRFGFHTALTGGLLYKTGPRKDIDVVLYIRGDSTTVADKDGLLKALVDEAGFALVGDYGYVVKTKHGEIDVDLLFPSEDGEYGPGATTTEVVSIDDDFDLGVI